MIDEPDRHRGPGVPACLGPPLGLAELVACFNALFSTRYRVRLLGGHWEPYYRPPTASASGVLQFTRDHAASALHEVAHWCIAGHARRSLADFGYCYVPAPRSREEQEAFLSAEVKAQALEWWFADAAGVPFRLSFDDLEDAHSPLREPFRLAVQQRRCRLEGGLASVRAKTFRSALLSARVR